MQDSLLQNNNFKQDAHLLRTNELGGQTFLHQQPGTIIEKDIRIVEQTVGGTQHVHGSPTHLHGSPSHHVHQHQTLQGSPRLIQGSPTGLHGSPNRLGGYTQSLGGFTNQGQTIVTEQRTFVEGGQSLGHNHTHLNQGHVHTHNHLQGGQTFNTLNTHETIVERIVEAPIVVTHQEQAIVKSLYEGQQVYRTDEVAITQSHTLPAIVKEIHQDVIHEHHKDVLVEHKKDIVHEHHQNVIHQHTQPIIYEKHIHEHHQPIIHEKHTTLIEEKHVPLIHEQHTQSTNVQERGEVVTEVFEQPVVKEVFVNPVVKEVYAEATTIREGSTFGSEQVTFVEGQQHLHGGVHNHGHVHNHGGNVQTTVIEETYTTTGGLGGNHTHLGNQGTLYNQGQTTYLGEDQVYANEVDEFGRPKKAGFFQKLKTKMHGNKTNEQKII